MVFAVARTTARKAATFISHGGHNGPGQSAVHRLRSGAPVRHASTNAHLLHSLGLFKPLRSPANRLFSATRNVWTIIFNQLTAPGLRVPTYLHNAGAGAARSLHSGAIPTIKSGLSFHARTALSSGPRYYLPRPPSVGAHVVTNVGLGTARNFSTARPIFQNFVDNVPVIGRAFYEADLDLTKGHVKSPRVRRFKSSAQKKTRETLKLRNEPWAGLFSGDREAEIAHYLDNHIAPVTTYLFVPIAPTPSSRVPLPAEPILNHDSPALLPPLSFFAPHHTLHENHAARVSSLFLRLDQANVWSKGVRCSAYGQGSEDGGQCTVLAVEFTGWNEAEVRAVIGEGGTGWCALVERRFDDVDEMSELSATDSAEMAAMKGSGHDQVSSSFIMPTIDLLSPGCETNPPSSSPDPLSLPSSTFSSRPMSPLSDTFSEYDNPWREDESGDDVDFSHRGSSSENASERSWQRVGVLEFSAQHLNQRD